MRVAQEKVRQFHERYGYEMPNKPEVGAVSMVNRRHDLIEEELDEYQVAAVQGDLTKIADAIGDMLYVVIGTAVSHGIDIQPIFDEIHRSNMTKGPAADNPNKPTKGPGYEAPRLAPILFNQATGLLYDGRDL